MAFEAKVLCEVEKKARLFDHTKERISSQIKDNIKVAIDKLRAAEKELLTEVEFEFGDNPFAAFLGRINSDSPPTEAELKEVLNGTIPQAFGPSEDSFCSLIKEIELFKSWRKKKMVCLDLIPQNLKCTRVTCDAATFSWDAVSGCECFYMVEIRSPSTTETYNTQTTEFTVRGLESQTNYIVRAGAITLESGSQCLWSSSIKVQTDFAHIEYSKRDNVHVCIWAEDCKTKTVRLLSWASAREAL